jgi:membrane-associated phospholipid phosphatase
MIKPFLTLLFLLSTVFSFSQNIDIRILRYLNSQNPQTADNFFRFVSSSTDAVIVAVPVSLGIAGLIRNDSLTFRKACVIAATDVINYGAVIVLKYSLNRKRPYDKYSFINNKSDDATPSFPSGHTSGAFATATSLSLSYPKWYVIVPSFAWAGTVAYSRLHLGMHYPSDILGGIVVGMGSAFITDKANKWLNNRHNKKYGH